MGFFFVKNLNIQQVELDTLLKQANAITTHVPLTQTGEHPTYHLINAETLTMMKPETILINSARGAVVEEAALIADILKNQRRVVLDVFEHEPEISEELLKIIKQLNITNKETIKIDENEEYLVFGSFLVVEKFLSLIGFNESL